MNQSTGIKICVVDDDRDVRENTLDLLSTQYADLSGFESPAAVLETLRANDPVVILTDLRMPGWDGLDFIREIKRLDSELPVILMTGYGDISIAVDAMKHGAYDFIEKPIDANRLLESIQRAVDKRRLNLSLSETREKLEQHHSIDTRIIGHSPMMQQIKRDILRFAPMDIPVLIYGDTGTGKELVARCLHDFSERHDGPFVAINCGAIPENLAEAELFGFVKGAFTDASAARVGKLEYAAGGTLFLDEIESLPPAVQVKLLRVLQDGKLTPLGSNEEVETDCRVISASKEDLRDHPDFRQDLYFRLQVGECRIPPLKQRKEDILPLFEYFVLQNCENFRIECGPISDATVQTLLAYEWPGNIREMINVATRYVINGCNNLDEVLATPAGAADESNLSLKERVNAYEANLIRAKLAQHGGKVAPVLEDLSLERRTFNQKLARYGIAVSEYKK
jgi:two-component system C4-dicarboxylate transport response regulator DctD